MLFQSGHQFEQSTKREGELSQKGFSKADQKCFCHNCLNIKPPAQLNTHSTDYCASKNKDTIKYLHMVEL